MFKTSDIRTLAETFLRCDVYDFFKKGDMFLKEKAENTASLFWKQVLEGVFHYVHLDLESSNEVSVYSPLWLNSNIKIDKKSVFYRSWYNQGILFVFDLYNSSGNFMSYDEFCEFEVCALFPHPSEVP